MYIYYLYFLSIYLHISINYIQDKEKQKPV